MFGFGAKMDTAKIAEEVKTGRAVLVDVRGADEWKNGHAEGAVHIPVDKITSGTTPSSDKSKKVYLYCASGGRAGIAAQVLKQAGYEVENLGGLSSWQSNGGSVAH